MSPDPLGQYLGPNLYTYCWNDPVNLVDPLGLFGGKMPIDVRVDLYVDYLNHQMGKACDDARKKLEDEAKKQQEINEEQQERARERARMGEEMWDSIPPGTPLPVHPDFADFIEAADLARQVVQKAIEDISDALGK